MSKVMEQLKSAGDKVRLVGDKLRIDAPEGTLTPSLLEAVKEQKGEIIRELRHDVNYWLGGCCGNRRRLSGG